MGLEDLQAPVEEQPYEQIEEAEHEFKQKYPDTFSKTQTVALSAQPFDLGDSCANP